MIVARSISLFRRALDTSRVNIYCETSVPLNLIAIVHHRPYVPSK